MIKMFGAIILGVIAIIIWRYRAKYDPDVLRAQAKKKIDDELDRKKIELKRLNKEIDDVKKDLNDAFNLKDGDGVNRLSAIIRRLCRERDAISAELQKSSGS